MRHDRCHLKKPTMCRSRQLAELDRLPTAQRRRVLGSSLAAVSPEPRKITNGKRKVSAA
jgi:hypothetical protein